MPYKKFEFNLYLFFIKMSNKNSDDLCNMIPANEYDYYFDKRHINEETPYEIDEDRQIHCKILEQHYDMVCGINSIDEAMVK